MSYKKLAIICASCVPFLFTLNGEFVFDDSEAVVKNKDVTSDSWSDPFYHDFWGADITSDLSHKSYRPLTILSYKLDYLLSKRLDAYDFKTTNLILCHMLACLMVWLVFDTILYGESRILTTEDEETTENTSIQEDRKWWLDTAFLSALLFAVHPIHVEAVSGVVGRADLLAAVTFFLAFLSYNQSIRVSQVTQGGSFIFLLATVILAGISMLFKENGVTVLGFCLVYELTTKYKIKTPEERHAKILSIDNISVGAIFRMIFITFGIAALLYGRWLVMGGTKPEFKPTDNPAAFASTPLVKVATYNYIYFLNFVLLVWPEWLCYDWSMGCVPLIEKLMEERTVLMFLLHSYAWYLFNAIFRNNKNYKSTNRVMFLAASLIIIPFLPASNIFYPVGFVIAERVLYIPSAGYCLLVGIGLQKLLHGRSLVVYKMGLFMFLSLIVIFALRSWQRSIDWEKEHSLFVSGLVVCPLNAKVHYNVAKMADAKHQSTYALAEYKEAIRLYPEYYQAMNNLANLLKNLKQYDQAEHYLRLAVEHREDFPPAWMNLGILLATTGRFEESEIAYRTALRYRKKYPDCYYNLGNLYLELNKTEDALGNWFEAINLNPKHVLAWTNSLALMDNTGQINRALKFIPSVLKELPEAPSINFAIANMYGKINRYEEAETYFLKAIKLINKEVKAIHFANLGVLYHRWKKYTLAEEMYRSALKIDPTFKTARTNLVTLKAHNYLGT